MLLAGCILAACQNTFCVPFLLDDSDSIEKNKTIRSFATALAPPANSGLTVSGRPLLNLSLAINYRLGGTDVIGQSYWQPANSLCRCTLFIRSPAAHA